MEELRCVYDCAFHRGKIDWHHPISTNGMIGMYLCEAHHSILYGRKKRYNGEMVVNKTLTEMYRELKQLERDEITKQGGNPDEIDKH